MFCESCGLQFSPKQSVCTGCGVASTRTWLQLMSLITLLVAIGCNSLVAWYVLPRLVAGHQSRLFFRAWLWLSERFSVYGWVPVAMSLLAWDYLIRPGSKPKIKRWVARRLLIFVLLTGIAPLIPWWLPAGQPPAGILAAIHKNPGLPLILPWGVVLLVAGLLCLKADTRDSLLGHGRVLSLVSLGLLVLVLVPVLLGWSFTYR